MLKYQKAKVKLLEYEVPQKEWPIFPLNYRDLAYPTVLTISKCAEAINENTDIIIALVGGKTSSSGITTTYSFFYKNGLVLLLYLVYL